MDYKLSKPVAMTGYSLHRLVAGLLQGEKALFSDQGDHVRLRTAVDLTLPRLGLPDVAAGSQVAFQLQACVSKKTRGVRSYFDPADHASRHAWLAQKGLQCGFEVSTVYCTAGRELIVAGRGRRFSVDKTTFNGILKVTNPDLFQAALAEGVGNTGRAFGFGLLII